VLATVNRSGGQTPHVVMSAIFVFGHVRYYRTYHCQCKALVAAETKAIP
jgi:hypothetical protein